MLTKDDLQQIGEVVKEVVKVELKPAEDRLRVEIKASHDDLKGDFRYVIKEIGRLDEKIDGLEGRANKRFDEVIQHVDGFAQTQKKFDAELASHQSHLKRLDPSSAGV